MALILGVVPGVGGRQVAALPLRWLAAPGWYLPPPDRPVPLVAFQEPCALRRQAVGVLEGLGWPVRITTEAVNLEGVLAAARARLGIALLPTAFGVPKGLEEITPLPAQDPVGLRLLSRRGLDPEIESSACAALREFFSSVVEFPGALAAQVAIGNSN